MGILQEGAKEKREKELLPPSVPRWNCVIVSLFSLWVMTLLPSRGFRVG